MHGDLTLSKDEWLSVLKLSTRWQFNDFRAQAIERLSDYLDSIEKVQLGKEYNVEAWLLSGCRELVSRESVISIEDAEKLNWKVALNLYIIRDGFKTSPLAEPIDDQVRKTFAIEFERIKSSQRTYLTASERLREMQEEEERRRDMECLAAREAETHRLNALADEEEKRVGELALELENSRRKLQSFRITPTTPSTKEELSGGGFDSEMTPKVRFSPNSILQVYNF
jgi:hypothetical protein